MVSTPIDTSKLWRDKRYANAARDEEIVRLHREEEYTQVSIAKAYGMSRARVSQIIQAFDEREAVEQLQTS